MNFKKVTFSALTALTLINAVTVQADTTNQESSINYNYVEGTYSYSRITGVESSDLGLDLQLHYLINDPVFIIAGYEYTEFKFDDGVRLDAAVFSLGAGARFMLQNNLDAYVSATYDNYENDTSFRGFSVRRDADGFTAKAGLRYAANTQLELDGAIVYQDIDFDGRASDLSETGVELTANYAINNNWSVVSGYEHIDDTNTFKLGARFSF